MLQEVEIDKLKVSQTNLISEHYNKYLYLSLDKLAEDGPAQAWKVNGDLILADGHHRIARTYEKGGKTYLIEVFKENDPFYEMVFEGEVKPRFTEAQAKGVDSISDLLERDIIKIPQTEFPFKLLRKV